MLLGVQRDDSKPIVKYFLDHLKDNIGVCSNNNSLIYFRKIVTRINYCSTVECRSAMLLAGWDVFLNTLTQFTNRTVSSRGIRNY